MKAEHIIIAAGTALALLLAAGGSNDAPTPRQGGNGGSRVEDMHNPLLPSPAPAPMPRKPGT